jgi:hypothetical protein
MAHPFARSEDLEEVELEIAQVALVVRHGCTSVVTGQ